MNFMYLSKLAVTKSKVFLLTTTFVCTYIWEVRSRSEKMVKSLVHCSVWGQGDLTLFLLPDLLSLAN